MIATEYLPIDKRSQAGQPVSSWIRGRLSRLGLLISGPTLCLGLSLLGLAPLLLLE
jgi:hypothetical protein